MPLTSTTGGNAHSTSSSTLNQHGNMAAGGPGYPMGQSAATSTSSLFGVSGAGLNRSNSTIHHHQRTRHVIASSFSQTASMTGESYSTTNSTFWPYRLLICILDQRDIATPILETLCIDILR